MDIFQKKSKSKSLGYFIGLFLLLAFISDLSINPGRTITEFGPFIILVIAIFFLKKSLSKKIKFKIFSRYREKINSILMFFGLIFGLFLGLILVPSFAPLVMIIVISLGIYLINNKIKNKKKKQEMLSSGIEKIDSMTGEDFEIYLEFFFKEIGYIVDRTQLSGDYGADLIITKDGIRTAVQAKRYTNKVGLEAVQQVVAAKAYYHCENGVVVTNNYFTPAAINLAESNKIILWDRDQLITELISVRNKINESNGE